MVIERHRAEPAQAERDSGTPNDDAEPDRWRRRPVAAASVRVAVVGLPLSLSVAVAVVFEMVVPKPHGTAAVAAWWLGTLTLSTLALLGLERVARRALPLAALLKMGMLFPGAAPRRHAVARRAASTRDLERRLHEARAHQPGDDSTVAAERVVTLAASLSAHDRKTRGHTERVRALTDFIADELQLPEPDRDRLRWSALLHDIGKLAVHADILNKEGPLTDEEWQIIRQHPLEGAKLTAPLSDWLGDWASTIVEHHERYDGGGYPFGLSGDHISLGGRIVAVADTYDVMTTTRSYKRSTSPEAARQELVRCAGTQFDPAIVRAFLGVPVRRLRGLVPLSWLGSFVVDNLGPALSVASRVGTAAAAAVTVVGVSAWKPWSSGPTMTATQTLARTAHRDDAPAVPAPGRGGTAVTGAGPRPGRTSGGGASGAGSPGHASGTTGSGRSGAQNDASGAGGGSGPLGSTATSTAAPGGVAVTIPGSPGTTTPGSPGTTAPGSPGTTMPSPTTTTAPTETTVPSAPPPQPPTNLKTKAGCTTLGLIGPEIAVTWTRSTTSSVTGYDILRSKSGGAYTAIATVGSTVATYTDTTVTGVGTAYSYEVEAVSPGGSALSVASGASTTLCL